jgi:hypothetical protein
VAEVKKDETIRNRASGCRQAVRNSQLNKFGWIQTLASFGREKEEDHPSFVFLLISLTA